MDKMSLKFARTQKRKRAIGCVLHLIEHSVIYVNQHEEPNV